MGIGTRSKSQQGEGSGQEPSPSRMAADANNAGGSEKGMKGATNGSESAALVAEHRRPKQTKQQQDQASNEEGSVVFTRTRGIKRPRRDVSPPGSPVKKIVKEVKTATPEAKKRQWESWTIEEKSSFFQALNEYGKDFEGIQNMFAQKYKKKGAPPSMIKNKDQVRYFYYRTWHKIAKYVKANDGIKKQTLEVYGLINYGELRKKIGGRLAEKNLHKLSELINSGATMVKVKGKINRIRTPVCNALKKLNNVEDPKKETSPVPKVPERITLELCPRNNAAWSHVQSMAQNPRLRITLKSERHISSVIAFLKKKWKPPRLKMESLNVYESVKELFVYPHRASNRVVPVSVQVAETQPRLDLALSNYKGDAPATKQVCRKTAVSTSNENSLEPPDGILSPKLEDAAVKDNTKPTEVTSCLSLEPDLNSLVDGDNAMFPDNLLAAPKNSDTHNSDAVPPKETKKDGDTFTSDTDNEIRLRSEEMAREGWSLSTLDYMTVAELYLMFGRDSHLKLEYDWCETKLSAEDSLVPNLANMLRRLVHLATLEFTDCIKEKTPKAAEKSKANKVNDCSNVCEACGRQLESGGPSRQQNRQGGRNSSVQKSSLAVRDQRSGGSTNKNGSMVKCGQNDRDAGDNKEKANDPKRVDGVFRVPVGIPGPQTVLTQKELKPSDVFQPRHRKKLQRNIRKSVVLNRTLDPKAAISPRGMVTLTMLPNFTPLTVATPIIHNRIGVINRTRTVPSGLGMQLSTLSPFSTNTMPVLTQPIMSSLHNPPTNSVILPSTSLNNTALASVTSLQTVTTAAGQQNTSCSTLPRPSTLPGIPLQPKTSFSEASRMPLLSVAVTSSIDSSTVNSSPVNSMPACSSPNISSFLDISLSDVPMSLLDSNECKGPYTDSGLTTPPLRSDLDLRQPSPSRSPTQSPFKISSLLDPQWLNGEVGDVSLSSLLGDSPLKKCMDSSNPASNVNNNNIIPSLGLFSESSRDSIVSRSDVDAVLQCIMNENSMDYVSKFADLAAQIAATSDTSSRKLD